MYKEGDLVALKERHLSFLPDARGIVRRARDDGTYDVDLLYDSTGVRIPAWPLSNVPEGVLTAYTGPMEARVMDPGSFLMARAINICLEHPEFASALHRHFADRQPSRISAKLDSSTTPGDDSAVRVVVGVFFHGEDLECKLSVTPNGQLQSGSELEISIVKIKAW